MKKIFSVLILSFSVISILVGCVKKDTKYTTERNVRVTSTTASVTKPAWMEEETLEDEASVHD